MKRILFILTAIMIMVSVNAQKPYYPFTSDTMKGANAKSVAYPYKIQTLSTYSFQFWQSSRIAGTDSVDWLVQGSNDNSNWYTLGTYKIDNSSPTNFLSSNTNGYTGLYLRAYTAGNSGDTLVYDASLALKPLKNEIAYQYTFTADTATNTETVYLTYPYAIDTYPGYSFQIIGAKLSGNNSCTCTLEESNDKTNWNAASETTLTLSNSSSNLLWQDVDGLESRYLRGKVVCSGTHVTRFTGSLVFKANNR